MACGENTDCVLVKKDEIYRLFVGDKSSLELNFDGDFETCMLKAITQVGKTIKTDRPISRMQIKMLAPEYPTTALDWYGANCCICWKTWKDTVVKLM